MSFFLLAGDANYIFQEPCCLLGLWMNDGHFSRCFCRYGSIRQGDGGLHGDESALAGVFPASDGQFLAYGSGLSVADIETGSDGFLADGLVEVAGHGLIHHGGQDAAMHDAIVALIICGQFFYRHILTILQREVEFQADGIGFATGEAVCIIGCHIYNLPCLF